MFVVVVVVVVTGKMGIDFLNFSAYRANHTVQSSIYTPPYPIQPLC